MIKNKKNNYETKQMKLKQANWTELKFKVKTKI